MVSTFQFESEKLGADIKLRFDRTPSNLELTTLAVCFPETVHFLLDGPEDTEDAKQLLTRNVMVDKLASTLGLPASHQQSEPVPNKGFAFAPVDVSDTLIKITYIATDTLGGSDYLLKKMHKGGYMDAHQFHQAMATIARFNKQSADREA